MSPKKNIARHITVADIGFYTSLPNHDGHSGGGVDDAMAAAIPAPRPFGVPITRIG